MGCPLRVRVIEMFLSGTQRAASAQRMCSRAVFRIRSNSSASLSVALCCEDICSSSDRSRSRPPSACSWDPSLARSDSSRCMHSRTGVTICRTYFSDRASLWLLDRPTSRLTTPSSSLPCARNANEYTVLSASGVRTMPGNSSASPRAFEMASLTMCGCCSRVKSSEAQTRLENPSCTTMPRRVGMSMRRSRPYGSNEASVETGASPSLVLLSSATAILEIRVGNM